MGRRKQPAWYMRDYTQDRVYRLELRVPYAERQAAKRGGARWDAIRRTWYINDPKLVPNVMPWLPTVSSLSGKAG